MITLKLHFYIAHSRNIIYWADFLQNGNILLSRKMSYMRGFSFNSNITLLCFLGMFILINHTKYAVTFWSYSTRNHKTDCSGVTESVIQSESAIRKYNAIIYLPRYYCTKISADYCREVYICCKFCLEEITDNEYFLYFPL